MHASMDKRFERFRFFLAFSSAYSRGERRGGKKSIKHTITSQEQSVRMMSKKKTNTKCNERVAARIADIMIDAGSSHLNSFSSSPRLFSSRVLSLMTSQHRGELFSIQQVANEETRRETWRQIGDRFM
jgi:hypothetical protein